MRFSPHPPHATLARSGVQGGACVCGVPGRGLRNNRCACGWPAPPPLSRAPGAIRTVFICCGTTPQPGPRREWMGRSFRPIVRAALTHGCRPIRRLDSTATTVWHCAARVEAKVYWFPSTLGSSTDGSTCGAGVRGQRAEHHVPGALRVRRPTHDDGAPSGTPTTRPLPSRGTFGESGTESGAPHGDSDRAGWMPTRGTQDAADSSRLFSPRMARCLPRRDAARRRGASEGERRTHTHTHVVCACVHRRNTKVLL